MPIESPANGRLRKKIGRNGEEYWYWECGSQRTRVHGEYATPDFDANLERIRAANTQPARLHTIADLAHAFERSKVFRNYAASTQSRWKHWFPRIATELGSLSIKVFDDSKSIRLIERWRMKRKHNARTSDYGLTVLSRMLSYAITEGAIGRHFCSKVSRLYKGDRSHITWTDPERDKLMSVAPIHMRRFFELGYLTCLREGDLMSLRWTDVKDDCIEVWTNKSGGRTLVEVPLHPPLRALLSTIPRTSTHVLCNSRGKPWRSGFTSSWRKLRLKSGIVGKTFHDLRGTGATKLYEAGVPIEDIILLLGWSERHAKKVIHRYISRKNQFAALKGKMNLAFADTTTASQAT